MNPLLIKKKKKVKKYKINNVTILFHQKPFVIVFQRNKKFVVNFLNIIHTFVIL